MEGRSARCHIESIGGQFAEESGLGGIGGDQGHNLFRLPARELLPPFGPAFHDPGNHLRGFGLITPGTARAIGGAGDLDPPHGRQILLGILLAHIQDAVIAKTVAEADDGPWAAIVKPQRHPIIVGIRCLGHETRHGQCAAIGNGTAGGDDVFEVLFGQSRLVG